VEPNTSFCGIWLNKIHAHQVLVCYPGSKLFIDGRIDQLKQIPGPMPVIAAISFQKAKIGIRVHILMGIVGSEVVRENPYILRLSSQALLSSHCVSETLLHRCRIKHLGKAKPLRT
jgi:hypothetical protein